MPAVSTAAGILADRAQAQPEAGLGQHEPGDRHREQRDVDQGRVAREQHVPEALRPFEGRGAPALPVPGVADDRSETGGEHVDGDARDDLVAALADRREAVDQSEDATEAPMPAARPIQAELGLGGGGGREGGDEHLALEPDIDHAGALGPQAGEAGGEQRDREPQSRIEDRDDGAEIHGVRPSRTTARGRSARRAGGRGPRARPANRMMMPPITTTMSRVMAGCSKASSAPPW